MIVGRMLALILITVLLGGCGPKVYKSTAKSGGVLAVRFCKKSTNGSHDQSMVLYGEKPYPFELKLYPGYRGKGFSEYLSSNWYAFSEVIPEGRYEIKGVRMTGSVDEHSLSQIQKDNNIEVSKGFEIVSGEITLLDRYFYISWENKGSSLKCVPGCVKII